MPIITELEPPMCSKWSVGYTGGTPAHIIRMTADHALRQDIFTLRLPVQIHLVTRSGR
jgi:hypothetical protein